MIEYRKGQGFTLVEVLITLAIFMVAMTGMVALQRVSSEGANRGKKLTDAVNAAIFFMTQLENEINAWKHGDEYGALNFPTNQYSMLSGILGTDAAGINNWATIDPNQETFRVDQYLGHSELEDSPALFCINYMISPLQNMMSESEEEMDNDDVMVWKARVRVSWPKGGSFKSNLGWQDCTPAEVDTRVVDDSSDEAVELVSILSREFAQ